MTASKFRSDGAKTGGSAESKSHHHHKEKTDDESSVIEEPSLCRRQLDVTKTEDWDERGVCPYVAASKSQESRQRMMEVQRLPPSERRPGPMVDMPVPEEVQGRGPGRTRSVPHMWLPPSFGQTDQD